MWWPTPEPTAPALLATLPAALLAALLAGASVAWVLPRLLLALPRPEDAPDYAALGTPGFRVLTAVAVATATLIAAALTPPAHWVAWAALSTTQVVAAAIDARTTWLPRALSLAGWAVATVGVVVAAALSGSPGLLLASALGALALGGFFHAVWAVSHQIGYGDVRLMATVGGVTALAGPDVVGWSALIGTAVGAGWALARSALGRTGAFPYAPALLAGPFLALLLTSAGQ